MDLVFCRYARVHQSACTPNGQQKELTSQEVNAELAKWKPSYDYGTDSVFSVKPPVVSPQDMALYEKSCRVANQGPLPSYSEYQLYVKRWSNVWCCLCFITYLCRALLYASLAGSRITDQIYRGGLCSVYMWGTNCLHWDQHKSRGSGIHSCNLIPGQCLVRHQNFCLGCTP